MDKQFIEVEKELDVKLKNFGWNKQVADKKSISEMLRKQGLKTAGVGMTDVREASKDHVERI